MIYISSGVLQVIAEDDAETPVLSLSSGTVLGEGTLLMPSKCRADVRCATHVKLCTLNAIYFYKLLNLYPSLCAELRAKRVARTTFARMLKQLRYKRIGLDQNMEHFYGISWLKTQWRVLTKETLKVKKNDSPISLPLSSIDGTRTSRHLDLLVLSKEVELITNAVCLQMNCPCILQPKSNFIVWWNNIIVFISFITVVLFPYYMAFIISFPNWLLALDNTFNIACAIDIYLQVSTAAKVQDNLILVDILGISKLRFQKPKFIFDVFANVPVEWFIMIAGIGVYEHSVYRVNKLLRIIRLYDFMIDVENRMGTSFGITRMWRPIFTYFITSYWLAMAIYAMACSVKEQKCGNDYWIGHFSDLEKSCFEYPLVISTYYVLNTIASIGLTLFFPINYADHLVDNAMVAFGLLLFFYFCGEIGARCIIQSQRKHKATESLFMVIYFLKIRKTSADIISRVRDHLCTQWVYNKFSNVVEGKLLNLASNDLHDKIIINSIIKTLQEIPLFFMVDDAILEAMAKKATVFLLTGGTKIGRVGHKPTAIYIIRNGFCHIVSGLPGDLERARTRIAGPGSLLLLTEFFYKTFIMADIYTITTCEIISIQHSDFWETLNVFPHDKVELETVIKSFHGIVKDALISLYHDEDTTQKSLKVVTLDEDLSYAQYIQPFKQIGRLSIIRYVMLRQGISPHGNGIAKWELFREIICFFSSIFYPQFFTAFVQYPSVRNIGYAMDIVGFIDMYIRLHISYYNEFGIFVSHPLCTAKHYMDTSLLTDVITTVPIEITGLSRVFGRKNKYMITSWFYLITRPLLIHRIFGRFASIGNDISQNENLFTSSRYFLIMVVVLNTLSCGNVLYMCTFKYSEKHEYEEMDCSSESWLTKSNFESVSYHDPIIVFCCSVYYNATLMFRCGNCLFTAATTTEMVAVLSVSMTLIFIWWIMIAELTSQRIGGDLTIAIHREDMKSFITYMKNENVPPDVILNAIDEIEYRWRCSRGTDWKKLLRNLPSQLYEEVALELHGSALAAVELFHEKDSSAIRFLAREVVEVYFRKGTSIIQRNEVQNNVFIVKSGQVDVLAADDSVICTLGTGGIFGAFKRKCSVRHTMRMKAHVHVVLLVITVDGFFKILDNFPQVRGRLVRATLFDGEFVDQKQTDTKDYDPTDVAALPRHYGMQSLFYVSENSYWYKSFHSLLCMPVSIFTIYLVTSQIALQTLNSILNAIIYTFDILFMVKILLGFHTTFIDENSGIIVDNYLIISCRYFKTIKLFWLDLFSCIPFEAFAYCAVNHATRAKLLTSLKINRLFRLFHIYSCHAKSVTKLNVSPMRRWTFLCSVHLMFIHIGVCLWIYVACSESGCRHRIPPNRELGIVTKRIHAMQLAYLYNFDLLTTVGSQDVQPLSILELVITIFLIILYQVMGIHFLTTVVAIIHLSQYSFANYEKQALRVHSYLKNRSLSPILLERVWQYLLQQWIRQRGAWMPSMILESPGFLRRRIMFEIYGYLLLESPVFTGLHEDFLYQLTARMKRCVYFPNNYLFQGGDIDHTMYFIHTGQVEVLTKDDDNSFVAGSILGAGNILGVQQGMISALPHVYSVRAITVTDVMTLSQDAWSDLLIGFPSAQIILNTRIANLA